ncbi:putative ER lumen protein retaining receptor [Lupinus albus]|uniref:Putative ER lumen protein retaining receptor n=1 Tax=Lupinus albus TaxID=3870 RepID=A0A6A4PPT7_LUPAL|nr:putative ER lumen protein retaining receptor [Lupinus albus]
MYNLISNCLQIYKTRGAYFFLIGSGYIWFSVAFLAEMVQSFILADFCYYYIKRYFNLFLLMIIACLMKPLSYYL